MEQIEKKEARYVVSQKGKPEVIILSVVDFMYNFLKSSKLLAEIQSSAARAVLNTMKDVEINAEISAYRKK